MFKIPISYFLIGILSLICVLLTFYLLNGSFCHLEYIKPYKIDVIPSYLGVHPCVPRVLLV